MHANIVDVFHGVFMSLLFLYHICTIHQSGTLPPAFAII